jgi:hypothetical protein
MDNEALINSKAFGDTIIIMLLVWLGVSIISAISLMLCKSKKKKTLFLENQGKKNESDLILPPLSDAVKDNKETLRKLNGKLKENKIQLFKPTAIIKDKLALKIYDSPKHKLPVKQRLSARYKRFSISKSGSTKLTESTSSPNQNNVKAKKLMKKK